MYFADFRANFCFFLTVILFYWLKWVLKKPFYLSNIMILIGYSFVGKNHFFVEKYDKKMAKIGTIFPNFLQFFVLFSVFSKVS